MTALERVRDAARAAAIADADLRRAVMEAHRDKVPVARIAEEARTTRQTIYRWLGTERTSNDTHAIRRGIRTLAKHLPPHQQGELLKRTSHTDERMLVMALGMGRRWVTSNPLLNSELSDDDRADLAAATAAENRLRIKWDTEG